MSKKLNSSLNKIEKVFEKMYHKGISVSGDRMSERTVKTYTDMMKALVRDVYEEFGVENVWEIKDEHVNQIIQRRIDSYHDGNTKEAYNLKTLLAAMKSFNLGVVETNIFKEKFEIGDPDEVRDTLKEQNVIRKSRASTVLRATPEECLSVLENIKNRGYDTDTREIAYHVGKIGLETGGRISAILRLRAGDIAAIDSEKGTITFTRDKGGLTRTVQVSKETAEYLQKLKTGKKEDQFIFSSKRANGTFKSIKEVRKEVSKIISDAGRHLTRKELVKLKDKDGNYKMVEVEKKFSSHCFRKAFALERTNQYYQKFSSKSAIDKFVSQQIKENPKIKEKLDIVRERINRTRKTPRDLTREEYAIFFTSVDLGHFRNDVITAFYTTFREVQDYYSKKN
jgi:integrase